MKNKWFGLVFLFFLVWAMVIPASAAQGGSYHAPAVTILTESAPGDLEITMNLRLNDGRIVPTQLQKKRVAWELQYRLYREAVFSVTSWFGNSNDLRGAELVLTSGGNETVVPLPRELTDQMTVNDVLTLNYRSGSIRFGAPGLRSPLMLALRLLILVGAELLIFRLHGYGDKRTMLIVAAVTLVTFGLFSIYTYGWLNSDPRRLIVYILFSILLVFVQTLCFVFFVEENTRNQTTSTTIRSSLAACVLQYLALIFLPV